MTRSMRVFPLIVRVHLDAQPADRDKDAVQLAVGGHRVREPEWRRRCADFENGDEGIRIRVDDGYARVKNEVRAARIVDALVARVEPDFIDANTRYRRQH